MRSPLTCGNTPLAIHGCRGPSREWNLHVCQDDIFEGRKTQAIDRFDYRFDIQPVSSRHTIRGLYCSNNMPAIVSHAVVVFERPSDYQRFVYNNTADEYYWIHDSPVFENWGHADELGEYGAGSGMQVLEKVGDLNWYAEDPYMEIPTSERERILNIVINVRDWWKSARDDPLCLGLLKLKQPDLPDCARDWVPDDVLVMLGSQAVVKSVRIQDDVAIVRVTTARKC